VELPFQNTADPSICPGVGTIGGDKVIVPNRGFNIHFQYYLPPCHAIGKKSRFPVIYLITVPFESRLDDQANTPMSLTDRLIHAGKMPPVIIIVPDDRIDFGYQASLAQGLVPYVESKFNIIPDRKYLCVGGISHGGAIAARTAFQFPDEFGSLGILSGGIADGEKITFDSWISGTSPKDRPRVRIDVGDQDSGIMPLTQNLVDVLDRHNIPFTLNISPGDHNWNFWSLRMESLLLWFAESWK
jgi:enterochelin esterase-like enzyme